jgi:hypothetical protein
LPPSFLSCPFLPTFPTSPLLSFRLFSHFSSLDPHSAFHRLRSSIFLPSPSVSFCVLTEVLYLFDFSITAQCAALDFVLKSVIEIVPSSTESLVNLSMSQI